MRIIFCRGDACSNGYGAPRDCPTDDKSPENKVPATSPARLLARSLTDPETRGEWKSDCRIAAYSVGFTYRNEVRNLTVTLGSGMGGSWVSTPFELTDDEKDIVREATLAFDAWEKEKAEQAALARLTAPASGTRPRENAKRSRAKPRGATA